MIVNQRPNMIGPEDICIFSTRAYEPEYIYKICIANSTPSLNTEQTGDDDLYVCYKASCYDARTAVQFIHKLLKRYRLRNARDLFVIDFDSARNLIDSVCHSYLEHHEMSLQFQVIEPNHEYPENNPCVSTPFVLSTNEETGNNSDVITM